MVRPAVQGVLPGSGGGPRPPSWHQGICGPGLNLGLGARYCVPEAPRVDHKGWRFGTDRCLRPGAKDPDGAVDLMRALECGTAGVHDPCNPEQGGTVYAVANTVVEAGI
ncbi:hypothetical protein NDU88_003415 [Pleurodeles waltl]|uniref:Uncharacterized protein n=1 Tax=Pleurodeles waltl TaxID=8319 RepID=A0AAV7MRR3_PLEWA|nr:hypothetical protein NDU88_003415 [Pleurodeles waltl]